MNRSKNTTNKIKTAHTGKAGKIKAKVLSAYYGNPIKDMKLICITGTKGLSDVAQLVYETLKVAGENVEVFASDEPIKVTALHKFFSDAWKAGANYVVVTAPVESLAQNAFYGLPVHIAAVSNFDGTSEDKEAISSLFEMNPEIVILNHDDVNYHDFASFAGQKATLTYGQDRFSAVQIEASKLYKRGAEAELNLSGTRFTVASFLTGEQAISGMAAAAAIASSLSVSPDAIVDGFANYEPVEEA